MGFQSGSQDLVTELKASLRDPSKGEFWRVFTNDVIDCM